MERLGLVAVRPPRAYAAPFAFLLAVTVAVVLLHDTGSRSESPAPVVAKTIVPTHRYYSVTAGDTFADIAAKTGVRTKRLQALNPRVEPTALHIGEKLRLR